MREDENLKELLRARRVDRLLARELRADQLECTRRIEWAVAAAKRRRSATEAPMLDFVRSALLLELPAPTERARALVELSVDMQKLYQEVFGMLLLKEK